MTEDPTTAPPRGPRADRTRLAVAAAGGGLAVVLIGAGAVAVSGMASADTSGSPAPAPSGSAAPGAPGGVHPGPAHGPGPLGELGGLGMLGGMGALGHVGDPLHGSAVVKDDDGDFVTYEAQRGTATAVSATSLTVKSEDGYTHTYVVDEDTVVNAGSGKAGDISDITTGEEVLVVATTDGGTSTATRVVDLAQLQQRLEDMMGRWQQGPPPGAAPWHRGETNHAPGNGSSKDGNGSPGTVPAPSAPAPTIPTPGTPTPSAPAPSTTT